MSLPAGSRLGHFEILGPIGAGGMGEVYRSRDPRLGRDVAIKVLPEGVAGDPEALSRFEREARAVAALSHPNILAIHDFGVEGGTAYAVTEMLEGETLRTRLEGGALPVRKAVDLAAQIARGLAAAHEKGIIHRDLKPENIFITHDGRAKILDFGLAKVEVARSGDLTASPTAALGTRPGVVMGTMAYMSPEQVRGQSVDPRSDLFSFGSVLYEMLTGRKAFLRDTAADTMSAILKEEPPELSHASQELPMALQRILEHSLEKNPAERFQSARDLAFHLEAISASSTSSAPRLALAGSGSAGRYLRMAGLLGAGVAIGVAIGAALAPRFWSPAAHAPPTFRYLSYAGRDSDPSTSADGRLIAYTSVHDGLSQIWLKQFPGGDEVALTRGPDDRLPRISRDGSQVLFTRVTGAVPSLYKVPVVGGEPRKIVDNAYDADWSPDGLKVAFLRDRIDNGELSATVGIADASGQEIGQATTPKLAHFASVRWSPDGKSLVAVNQGAENAPNTFLLMPAGGGESRTLIPPPPRGRLSAPVWVSDGSALLYSQTGSFAASGTDEGSSRVIRQEIASERSEIKMWLPFTANVIDRIGADSIVLGVSFQRQNLTEMALDGGPADSRTRQLTRGNSTDRQPIFSPDGRWILFSSNRGGNLDLWKLEVATGAIRRITEDRADDWDPAFTPDGRSILWSSNRGGHFEIWMCAADGTGSRQITQDGVDAENPTATPDGRWIVYNSTNPSQSGVWKIRPDGTGATRIVPGTWSTPDVSPDGRHVIFRSGAEPRAVSIAQVEDGRVLGAPIVLPGSVFNGRPRWMPDGRRFLYTASDATGARGIYIQDFVPGQDTTATRRRLGEFVTGTPPESFCVTPDGTRLVFSTEDKLDSLMLAQGLSGIGPVGSKAR